MKNAEFALLFLFFETYVRSAAEIEFVSFQL